MKTQSIEFNFNQQVTKPDIAPPNIWETDQDIKDKENNAKEKTLQNH